MIYGQYMPLVYNARFMKTYMIEIWKHISINIKSICPKLEFENFHISIKNEKFRHISVKIKYIAEQQLQKIL